MFGPRAITWASFVVALCLFCACSDDTQSASSAEPTDPRPDAEDLEDATEPEQDSSGEPDASGTPDADLPDAQEDADLPEEDATPAMLGEINVPQLPVERWPSTLSSSQTP